MRAMCSCAMPEPVSETRTLMACPLLVETISVPPLGMASFALRNRFRNTCQFSGITVNMWQTFIQFILHFDTSGPELMFQQSQRVRDHFVDVYVTELGAAGTREVQQ